MSVSQSLLLKFAARQICKCFEVGLLRNQLLSPLTGATNLDMKVTFSLSLSSEMSHGPAIIFFRYIAILSLGTLTLSISYFLVNAVFDLSVRPR